MKLTVLYLALLVFTSCTDVDMNMDMDLSTDLDMETTDPILLEFSQDERAEAIFATMAIQMEQSGGFDRILALLTELVVDGRRQLHQAIKTWRRSSARCEVSSAGLRERQDYYE